MPRKITDSCIACGTCAANCPVQCIAEGDIYSIDPDQCIDCGLCEENCPVQAIVEEQLKASKKRSYSAFCFAII